MAAVLSVLLIWGIAMAFLWVRHVSEHGFPRREVSPPEEPSLPPPTRAEVFGAVRENYEEQMRCVAGMGLTQEEYRAAMEELRRRYLRRIDEVM